MGRASKTCSWRDPVRPSIGCAKRAIFNARNGDDFRCPSHQRVSWEGVSDKRRRVPALTEAEKNFVRERDWGVCCYCGAEAREVDHVKEVSDGGDNRPSNLQLLCDEHHREKTRRGQEEWKADDARRGTSARAKAKRRRRQQGFYQQ